jgi:hypothetical protein
MWFFFLILLRPIRTVAASKRPMPASTDVPALLPPVAGSWNATVVDAWTELPGDDETVDVPGDVDDTVLGTVEDVVVVAAEVDDGEVVVVV